jgi:hypothetical protein
LDGLVELSTFFMIARRHCAGRLSSACNALYWASTIALRFMLQPFLLLQFHTHSLNYEWSTRAMILGSQTFLCLFNFGCAPPPAPGRRRSHAHGSRTRSLVAIAVNARVYRRKEAAAHTRKAD